jgi:hypothetical protein
MIVRIRLRYVVAAATVCALLVPAVALAGKTHHATAHAASHPCRFYRNVQSLINDVSQVPADSLTLDECGVALASVCAAEQYNERHSRNVPFYTNQNFYRSCERAYRFLKSSYLRRSNSKFDCGLLGWAAVFISPFVPVETIEAKLLAVAVGATFKFAGC